MARPKNTPMTAEQSAAIINNLAQKIEYIDDPKAKVMVLKFQMGLPSDLLGSKLTFTASRNTSLEATPLGIIMRSKESKRKMLVTWANVKAAEFSWDGEV